MSSVVMLTCKMNYFIESAIVEIFPKTSKPFEYFVSIYVPELQVIYSDIMNVILNREKNSPVSSL